MFVCVYDVFIVYFICCILYSMFVCVYDVLIVFCAVCLFVYMMYLLYVIYIYIIYIYIVYCAVCFLCRLSSFVAKCFHEAKGYIPIDDLKIASTLNWIMRFQGPDGAFIEPPLSRVIHTDMQVIITAAVKRSEGCKTIGHKEWNPATGILSNPGYLAVFKPSNCGWCAVEHPGFMSLILTIVLKEAQSTENCSAIGGFNSNKT